MNAASSSDRTLLRVGLLSPPDVIDPRTVSDLATELVCRQIYDTPLRPADRSGQLGAAILTAAPVRRGRIDGLDVQEAEVAAGLTFSDGTRCDAECVAASLRRSEALPRGVEVEAVDSKTLRFSAESLPSNLGPRLTDTRTSVVLESGDQLLGTGPFRRVESDTEGGTDCLMLEANPHARHRPLVDGIEFLTLPSEDDGTPRALLDALRQSEVDLTQEWIQVPANVPGLRVRSEPGFSTALLFFNTARAPFSDLAARQAACLAIDRRDLASLLYEKPLAYTASSPLPPRLGRSFDRLYPDPARASALAAGITVDRPLRLQLIWAPRPYLPRPLLCAGYIKDRLALLGWEVEIVETESSLDFDLQSGRGDYDLILAGWMLESLDPGDYLTAIYGSDRIPVPGDERGGNFNVSRWESPAMDEALVRYRRTGKDDALQTILDLQAEALPLMPLLYGSTSITTGRRVTRASIEPDGFPDLAKVELS